MKQDLAGRDARRRALAPEGYGLVLAAPFRLGCLAVLPDDSDGTHLDSPMELALEVILPGSAFQGLALVRGRNGYPAGSYPAAKTLHTEGTRIVGSILLACSATYRRALACSPPLRKRGRLSSSTPQIAGESVTR